MRCIARRYLCDGDNDCVDHSDEDTSPGAVCGEYLFLYLFIFYIIIFLVFLIIIFNIIYFLIYYYYYLFIIFFIIWWGTNNGMAKLSPTKLGTDRISLTNRGIINSYLFTEGALNFSPTKRNLLLILERSSLSNTIYIKMRINVLQFMFVSLYDNKRHLNPLSSEFFFSLVFGT